MDFEPMPQTKYRMISGSRPSIVVLARHYGVQFLSQAFGKIGQGLLKYMWVFVLLAVGGGIACGVRALILYAHREDAEMASKAAAEAKAADKEKWAEINRNSGYAHKNLDDWSKAFLGSLVLACSEMYENDAPHRYTITCFIGAKGALPTKKLECTDLNCNLSAQ